MSKKKISDYVAINEQTKEPNTEKPVLGSKYMTKVNDNGRVSINTELLRKDTNVFFATPCYGGNLTDQYFLSMFRLAQVMMVNGLNFRISTLRNESLIPRARNILQAMFLEDKSCSHLMFIDADIEFEAESLIRMLAMDKELIVGAYPKKTIVWSNIEQAVKNGEKDIHEFSADYAINLKFVDKNTKKLNVQDGAVELHDASTGFMLIKRCVFEKMIAAMPELKYVSDSNVDPKFNDYFYALFDTWIEPETRRYLSEDYTFCRRWQNLGGQIWLDPNTKLNHVGSYTFPGNIQRLFKEIKVSPTEIKND